MPRRPGRPRDGARGSGTRRPSTALTRSRVRRAALAYRKNLKLSMIQAYGGACTCCEESIAEFLSLEHLAGDGAEHRAIVGRNAQAQLVDLRDRGWPEGYTVLCLNCNLAKATHGTCPHTWTEYTKEMK